MDVCLQPGAGETWEFRGFESGRFRGRPVQYYFEVGMGPVTGHTGFTTELEGFMPVPDKAAQERARKASTIGEAARQPADKSEKVDPQKPKRP